LSGQKEEDQTSAERSIYYNKDHQVVDDNNTFLYESEDGNRSLEIGVRTTESGIITEFEDDDLKTSVINNRDVTIARLAAEDECYLASFYKGRCDVYHPDEESDRGGTAHGNCVNCADKTKKREEKAYETKTGYNFDRNV